MPNRFAENSGGDFVGWRKKAVVHPFPLAARGDDSGAAQVSQVARNFRLAQAQNFDEIANADFAIRHEIEQAEARGVGERAKEKIQGKGSRGLCVWNLVGGSHVSCHAKILTHSS